MESLFRQNTNKMSWDLDIEIIGDPDYLGALDDLRLGDVRKRTFGQRRERPTPGAPPPAQSYYDRIRSIDNIKSGKNQVLIGLVFKTPTDVDPRTLSYKGMKASELSRLYILIKVRHIFRNGKFTQELRLVGTSQSCCFINGDPKPTLFPLSVLPALTPAQPRPSQRSSATPVPSTAPSSGTVIDPDAVNPLPGSRVSSRFGPRTDPLSRRPAFHGGLDVSGPAIGTPINAGVTGTVVNAGPRGTLGNAVSILARNGYTITYAHLSAISTSVTVNATVNSNDIIGTLGSTGRSDGPHLHIEVKAPNGQSVNPCQYFPAGTFPGC